MATKAADNRYSLVKYRQTKYGPSAPVDAIGYGLEVDWNGDGLFDGSNEAIRMIGWSGFRGRQNMLKPDGSGFEQIQVGQFTFMLDNGDGRYNAWNTSSPLYPYVTNGVDVRFRTIDRNTGIIYPIFYGIVSDIRPVGLGTDRPSAQMTVQDAWTYLRNNNARVAIQQNIAPNAAINLILDSVGWPPRWGRALDASTDVIPYWWASGENNAGVECENLANSGGGLFFIDAAGRAKYMTRSDVPANTLSLTEETLLKDITPSQPWDNYRNIFQLTVNPKALAASGVIWKYSGVAPSIPPGSANALVFTAPYTYNNNRCPAINVLQPVPTTDWTTNSAQDGSGTDKTANCTLVIVDKGDSALVTVTNNDAGTVYLQPGAQIKGQAIYTQNIVNVSYPSDPSTVPNPRAFVQDLPWQQDINIASSIATVFGPFYSTRHPCIVCNIEARPNIQFTCDLFDIVTCTFPTHGINGDSFHIGGINYRSQDEACQDIVTTLYLEAYPLVSAAGLWGSAIWDTSVFGY